MEEDGVGLFAVDNWGCRKSKVFFLTHMHADHTKGLSQRWCRGPLYCSIITATLLRLKFPALDIHILPLSTPTLIPLPYPHLLEVTAIDADHCPGSVMFVFRGAFGCILHTGDFRWESGSPKLDSMKSCIAAAIGGSRVNLVHLDNTFCNPRFSFPTRHVAAQQVLDIIINHKGFDVLIGIDMLGKEELLIFIAKVLETKIWVWPERMQTMRVLGITGFFTADTTATRIRAVPRYSISHETLCMLNEIKPTIAVLPSGLNCLCKASVSSSAQNGTHVCYLGNVHAESKAGVDLHSLKTLKTRGNVLMEEGKDSQMKQSEEKYIFLVSYSLHSCFFELKEFLDFIKPLCVRGNLRSSRVNISPCQPLLQMCSNREDDTRNFGACGETILATSVLEPDESMQSGYAVNNDDKHSGMSSDNCTYKDEQYLHIVNRDATFSEKNKFFCKKLKTRIRLRQASCKRSQRAWAMLRRKRGGEAFLCPET